MAYASSSPLSYAAKKKADKIILIAKGKIFEFYFIHLHISPNFKEVIIRENARFQSSLLSKTRGKDRLSGSYFSFTVTLLEITLDLIERRPKS